MLTAALVLLLGGTATAGQPRLHGMNFFSNCYFSHISADDPIFYPGQPGVSHSHTFFGAVTTRPTKASAYFALRAHAMHVEEIVQACFEYTRRCNLPSKS